MSSSKLTFPEVVAPLWDDIWDSNPPYPHPCLSDIASAFQDRDAFINTKHGRMAMQMLSRVTNYDDIPWPSSVDPNADHEYDMLSWRLGTRTSKTDVRSGIYGILHVHYFCQTWLNQNEPDATKRTGFLRLILHGYIEWKKNKGSLINKQSVTDISIITYSGENDHKFIQHNRLNDKVQSRFIHEVVEYNGLRAAPIWPQIDRSDATIPAPHNRQPTKMVPRIKMDISAATDATFMVPDHPEFKSTISNRTALRMARILFEIGSLARPSSNMPIDLPLPILGRSMFLYAEASTPSRTVGGLRSTYQDTFRLLRFLHAQTAKDGYEPLTAIDAYYDANNHIHYTLGFQEWYLQDLKDKRTGFRWGTHLLNSSPNINSPIGEILDAIERYFYYGPEFQALTWLPTGQFSKNGKERMAGISSAFVTDDKGEASWHPVRWETIATMAGIDISTEDKKRTIRHHFKKAHDHLRERNHPASVEMRWLKNRSSKASLEIRPTAEFCNIVKPGTRAKRMKVSLAELLGIPSDEKTISLITPKLLGDDE